MIPPEELREVGSAICRRRGPFFQRRKVYFDTTFPSAEKIEIVSRCDDDVTLTKASRTPNPKSLIAGNIVVVAARLDLGACEN